MEKIHIDYQRANILTKPLAQAGFNQLCIEFGLLDPGEDMIEQGGARV